MKLTLLFLLSLLLSTAATAAGIGVAPAELSFNIEKGKTQQRQLTVYNLENGEVELEAASDSDFLKVYHSGSIGANAREKITVEANAKGLKKGSYNGSIYVTAKNQGSGVRLNLGTAVKAHVNVFTTRETSAIIGLITSASIVLAGLLAYFAATRLNMIFTSQKA